MQANKKVGMGLRHVHFPEILERLEGNPSGLGVDYFEIITENFFETMGRPRMVLEKVSEHFPLSFHGVSLSIAGSEDLDFEYLKKVKALEERFRPFLISDHLCWTGMEKSNLHNLLPFPYTQEVLKFLIPKILHVQDYLGRPLMLENLSAYIGFHESEMTEAQFLGELHKATGCDLLLDLNNVYVNSFNQNFQVDDWLKHIPKKAVKEIHLAGFSDMGNFYFDTHSCAVKKPVWDIYDAYSSQYSEAATTIEWDEDIPNYDVVLEEVLKARKILENK
ncbi:MAG: DUF692 domain-containing protein [Bdellovibrionales bacterium]|nr:DUF692 domain-containing protein [Bdellovibrionales bacterium]